MDHISVLRKGIIFKYLKSVFCHEKGSFSRNQIREKRGLFESRTMMGTPPGTTYLYECWGRVLNLLLSVYQATFPVQLIMCQ